MSSPLAVIGLTYGGTDVQDSDYGVFLELVRGLSEAASVRGTDTIVPGLAGRIVRDRMLDGLRIELQGYVMGAGPIVAGTPPTGARADFRTNAKAVRTLFDPTTSAALVATLEDGTTATVAARTLSSVWDQVTPELARVSIELEAVADWVVV